MPDSSTNITKGFLIPRNAMLFLLTLVVLPSMAQDTNYQRPALINDIKQLSEQVRQHPEKEMVELKSVAANLIYDLRYATKNNFMQRRMYPAGTNVTYLRAPAASALARVQKELNKKGLGLKIFDAYRPYSVTVLFWELVQDERYVAHPRKGSGHNRGISVDLTIINLKTKKELDMGTGFDNFSDTAHQSFTELSEEVLENRTLLKTLMQAHGFSPYEEEWWHYSYPNKSNFDILDIEFSKLKLRS